MQRFLLFLLLLSCFALSGQEIAWRSAGQVGAGYICSLPAVGDVLSFNPAVHAKESGLSGGVHYTLPFQMDAFSQQFGSFVYGSALGAFGLGLGSSGDNNSAYRRLGLQYARSFGQNVRAGLGYCYLSHHFSTQQNFNGSFSVAGIAYYASAGHWVVSVTVQNMEQQTISYPDHVFDIPSVVVTGVQWQASQGLYLLAEMEKDFDHRADFKGAIIYDFHKMMRVSVGAMGSNLSLTAGGGVFYRGVHLHVGMAHHRHLGLSTAASLSIMGLFGK